MNQTTTNDLIDSNLIKHWKNIKKLPKIIVFDLDYTLWPYYADCHVSPPILKSNNNNNGNIFDSEGFKLNGYNEVNKILYTLKNHCIDINKNEHLAIASRSTTRELALDIIKELGWFNYFSSIQIYPTSKKIHMKAILDELKMIDDDKYYKEILFFDDEIYNIKTTSSLGVCAIEIDPNQGLNMNILIDGLNKYEKK